MQKNFDTSYLEANELPWSLKGRVSNKARFRTMGTVPVSKHSGMRGVALQKCVLGIDLLPGHCLQLLSRAGKRALCGIPNPFPNLVLETSGTLNFVGSCFCPSGKDECSTHGFCILMWDICFVWVRD